MIRKFEHQVLGSSYRCLNTKTSRLSKYNTIIEEQMTRHKIDELLDVVIEEITKRHPTAAQSARIEFLDKQFVKLWKRAELWCRKILKPKLQFSGPVKL